MSITVALAGNPNSGKTTLFNKLTGSRQRVGNWPGVTIDRKVGRIKGTDAEIVDLPGIYSLSPYSPEERVTRNYVMEESPDVILNIVDASNLERNLYFTLQLIDMGAPVVVALNMVDVLEERGESVDVEALSKSLGCPVVPISALRRTGIDELVKTVLDTASGEKRISYVDLGSSVEGMVDKYKSALSDKVPENSARWFALKLLEKDEEVCSRFHDVVESLSSEEKEFEEKEVDKADSIVATARYAAIGKIIEGCMKKSDFDYSKSLSEKIDRIVTHRILGLPVFLLIIGAVFVAVIGFSVGDFEVTGVGTYLTDLFNGWIEDPFAVSVEQWCVDNQVSEELTGLLVNGIIAGVGAVIGFLPQMMILFVFMIILEEFGYMARAAFVMDRIFRHFGLSGKSFIPLLVGTGCGVPGIMSTRTIESERDRRITAMSVTFVPCGAKLPIIALIAGALFNENGLIALFCYILGLVVVLMTGLIMKNFKSFSGTPVPFIMELPPYHIPSWINIIQGTFERAWAFVKKAGTFVLLSAIVIWFFASYDPSLHYLGAGEWSGSMLQCFGEAVCGLFQPLGWGDNWQLTVSSISGLVAKENLVGTLGQLLGYEVGEQGEEIWEILGNMLTPAAGLAFLVFNLLCVPCFAAIGAMHRELGSWKDTGIAALYQCLIAYAVAEIVYVIVSFIDGQTPVTSGVVMCVISVIALLFLLIRPDLKLKAEKETAEEVA